jgi:hypothetical protein
MSRVYVLQSSKYLIDKILNVLICQLILRIDNFVQISFHEVQNHVDVLEWLSWSRGNQVTKANNILVVEMPKKLHLANDSLSIDKIVKGLGNLLNCNLCIIRLINGRANNTVSTSSQRFQRRVLGVHDKF